MVTISLQLRNMKQRPSQEKISVDVRARGDQNGGVRCAFRRLVFHFVKLLGLHREENRIQIGVKSKLDLQMSFNILLCVLHFYSFAYMADFQRYMDFGLLQRFV